MYCSKCGKELKEGQTCSVCGGNNDKPQVEENNSGLGGLLCCITGFVGALFTFPTFITELQHDARYRGGIINAIGRMFDNNFWLIPIVLLSTVLFIIGLKKILDKRK